MGKNEMIADINAWYRVLFDANPLPMLVYDRKTFAFLDVNQSAVQHYGYSRSEWLNMSIRDLHVAQEIPRVLDELRKSPEAVCHRAGVWRHLRKDHTQIHVDILRYLISFQDRSAALLILRDMTAQHRMEEELSQMQRDLNKAQEVARLGSWISDRVKGEVRWSDQEFRNFGLEPQSLVPSCDAFLNLVHPDDRQMVADRLAGALSGQPHYDFDHRVVWPDGSTHVMREQGAVLFDGNGSPRQSIGITLDITEQRQIENQLLQAQKDLSRAQELAGIGAWVWDAAKDAYEIPSAETFRILGLAPEDAPIDTAAWHQLIHPGDREAVRQARAQALAGPDARYDVEYRVVRHDGSMRVVHSMAEVLFDTAGTPLRMVGMLQDITEKKYAEEKIRHLAYHDDVTGLPNRVLLRQQLDKALASRCGVNHPIALLLIDLVRFRDINYTLGYANGDELLKEVGKRIKHALDATDMVARIGNEQFAVMLTDASAYEATARIRQIVAALEAPCPTGGATYELGTQLGVALAPGHGTDTDTLLRKADVALHQAKQSGQTYAIYQAALDPYKPQRLALMGEFRKAITNGQLQLYCQPKANLRTGQISGAEALVRWQHPEFGLVGPDQFVPLIEPTDLIHLLTKYMLRAALSQCHAWHQQGIHVPLAVNLSVRNLMEPDLAANLDYLLLTWGADVEWLGLEITESSLMADPVTSIAELDRLSKRGFRLFIDDFGTGYSSLSYLMKLPVNVIKIDHGFTMHMIKDKGAAAIVKSTIELAHNLGMSVVAEGTANREIWDALAKLGCDEAQGHYICPPIPAKDFADWLPTSGFGFAKAAPQAH